MKFKKNLFKLFSLLGSFVFPSLVFAETITGQMPTNPTVNDVVSWAHQLIVNFIIPFLFALATAAFIWGVIEYFLNPDNEEKKKKGKSFIIGGLLALFVMLSVWGIVGILNNTIFPGGGGNVIPGLPE